MINNQCTYRFVGAARIIGVVVDAAALELHLGHTHGESKRSELHFCRSRLAGHDGVIAETGGQLLSGCVQDLWEIR